jgi:cobalamin biosynthesis protein CobT
MNDPPKQGAKGSLPVCKCQRVDVDMGDLAAFQSDCKCMGSFDCRGKGEAATDDESDEDEEDDGDEEDDDEEDDESDEEEEESDCDSGEDDSSEDEASVHIRDPKEKRRPAKSRDERAKCKIERDQKRKEDRLQVSAKYFTNEALVHGGYCCKKRCHLLFTNQQLLAFRTKFHRLCSQEQGRLFLKSRMHIKAQRENNPHGMIVLFVPIMTCQH